MLVLSPFLCVMLFFVVYPLALDGYITTQTGADWALVLTPTWLLALLLTIVPLAGIILCVKDVLARDEHARFWKVVLLFVSATGLAAPGLFDFCLVALCCKA